MDTRKRLSNKRMLALTCGWALALSQSLAQAVPQQALQARPKINLFPTSVVESLSETSRAARSMESGMYEVVAKLDKQKRAYESTHCDDSDDQGCVHLRKAIRGSYKEMLDVMQSSIPEMRSSLDSTATSMGTSLRSEIGRKMTPGDVQRILAGRTSSNQAVPLPAVFSHQVISSAVTAAPRTSVSPSPSTSAANTLKARSAAVVIV